jgi:hypothetical protein
MAPPMDFPDPRKAPNLGDLSRTFNNLAMQLHPPLCGHVHPGSWPFEIELVIDEQVGFTDALVSCRTCGSAYLLEMLDWRGHQRLMRVSTVDSGRVQRLLHDIGRGSCDPKRAGAEVQHLQGSAAFVPWLLVIDARAVKVDAIAPLPEGKALPTAHWRKLNCDGAWLDLLGATSHSRSSG